MWTGCSGCVPGAGAWSHADAEASDATESNSWLASSTLVLPNEAALCHSAEVLPRILVCKEIPTGRSPVIIFYCIYMQRVTHRSRDVQGAQKTRPFCNESRKMFIMLLLVALLNADRLSELFHLRLGSKIEIKLLLKTAKHLAYVATLPCEIFGTFLVVVVFSSFFCTTLYRKWRIGCMLNAVLLAKYCQSKMYHCVFFIISV